MITDHEIFSFMFSSHSSGLRNDNGFQESNFICFQTFSASSLDQFKQQIWQGRQFLWRKRDSECHLSQMSYFKWRSSEAHNLVSKLSLGQKMEASPELELNFWTEVCSVLFKSINLFKWNHFGKVDRCTGAIRKVLVVGQDWEDKEEILSDYNLLAATWKAESAGDRRQPFVALSPV